METEKEKEEENGEKTLKRKLGKRIMSNSLDPSLLLHRDPTPWGGVRQGGLEEEAAQVRHLIWCLKTRATSRNPGAGTQRYTMVLKS